MGGAGGAAGVLLGGILTDLLSWRWILFINVPIGLIGGRPRPALHRRGSLRAERAELRPRRRGHARRSGCRCSCSASSARTSTGWGSIPTLALIAAGVVLLVAFVAIEGRFAKAPLMPLRIYASRTLRASNVVVFTLGAATFATVVLPVAVPPAGARILAVARRARVPADDALRSSSHRRSSRAGSPASAPSRCSSPGWRFWRSGLALVHPAVAERQLPRRRPGAVAAGGGRDGDGVRPGRRSRRSSGVAPHEAGLASGLVNTSRLFGGALGLAILAAHRHRAHEQRTPATPSGCTPRSRRVRDRVRIVARVRGSRRADRGGRVARIPARARPPRAARSTPRSMMRGLGTPGPGFVLPACAV